MKKMKKLLSMLLAVVMVLAMAAPSFAAEELASNLDISIENPVDGHSYQVYQIFTGRVSSEGTGENKKLTLSDVTWGKGVQSDDLLAALQSSTDFGAANPFTNVTTAPGVAEVLSSFSDNSSEAQAFAKIVGNYLGEVAATLNKEQNSTSVAAGYYMIKDTKEDDVNSVISSFILKVVDNTEAKLKVANAPKPEKTASNQSAIKEEIGKPITFTLKATLPSDNFADYDTYKLEFVDTLSAGLTYIYTDDVKDGIIAVKVDEKTLASNNYEVSYEDGENGTHVLTVTIANVKAENIGATAGSVITVEYTAKLNGNAIIHGEGANGATNTNDLKLNYSNNPNDDGTGTTVPGTDDKTTVTIDTFKITVDKIDGATAENDEPTKLKGAEFKLYKMENDARLYAVIDSDTKGVTWIPNKENGTTYTTTDGDEYAPVVFSGLTSGTYWVEEVKAPVGYNLAEAQEVTILDTDAAANMEVIVHDFAGTILPSTGGIGTTIFYAVGIILMAGAVFFVVRRKRA